MKFACVLTFVTLALPAFASRTSCKRAEVQPLYAQCGGNGFTGSTVCADGSVCTTSNEWYSQCLPGSQQTTAVATSTEVPVTTPAAPSTSSTIIIEAPITSSKAQVAAPITSSSSAIQVTTTKTAAFSSKADAVATSVPSVPGYSPASGIYPLGKSVKAKATTYGGDWTGGTCMFSDYPHANINGVALGGQQWFGAAGCGACVNITGPTGSITAMVNNKCPECVDNHLDLETNYAVKVDKDFATKGIFDISWDFIPCTQLSGSLQFKNKEGSSAYYFALQVRNSVLPIDKLEVSKDKGKTWTNVVRSDYNYFTALSGFGDVVDVRLTASTGAVIIENGIKVTSGGIVTGTKQFTA